MGTRRDCCFAAPSRASAAGAGRRAPGASGGDGRSRCAGGWRERLDELLARPPGTRPPARVRAVQRLRRGVASAPAGAGRAGASARRSGRRGAAGQAAGGWRRGHCRRPGRLIGGGRRVCLDVAALLHAQGAGHDRGRRGVATGVGEVAPSLPGAGDGPAAITEGEPGARTGDDAGDDVQDGTQRARDDRDSAERETGARDEREPSGDESPGEGSGDRSDGGEGRAPAADRRPVPRVRRAEELARGRLRGARAGGEARPGRGGEARPEAGAGRGSASRP